MTKTRIMHLNKTAILAVFKQNSELKKLKDAQASGLYPYRGGNGFSWYLRKRISDHPGAAVDFKLGSWLLP